LVGTVEARQVADLSGLLLATPLSMWPILPGEQSMTLAACPDHTRTSGGCAARRKDRLDRAGRRARQALIIHQTAAREVQVPAGQQPEAVRLVIGQMEAMAPRYISNSNSAEGDVPVQ
jgi:hypothetical protein